MGEGAYIRIQNKSSHSVTVSLGSEKGVDDQGLDKLQGAIDAGSSLPVDNDYQYIEGDVRFFFQKDGSFDFVATVEGDAASSSVQLKCDNDEWWCEDHTPDDDTACRVRVLADVTRSTGDQDGDDETHATYKIEVRIYDTYNGAAWMGGMEEVLRAVPLSEVGLPGTHDSGTYQFDKEAGASPDSDLTKTIQEKLEFGGGILGGVTDVILDNVFKRLCQCQEKSIQQQLELGVRYLDLRVGYHAESNKCYTCHGVFCVDMTQVLTEINDFLTANPKEIVIMDFNHLYDMDDHHALLVDEMLATLGDKVADSTKVNANSTVGEYWDNGYQAVILYCGRSILKDHPGLLWGQRYISSPWPNVIEPDALKAKLNDTIAAHDKGRFFVAQGILTPDTELIKKEVMESGGISLKTISTKCSPKVVDWIETEWKEQPLNICIVDFFENCSLVPAVIDYNRKKQS